MLQLIAYKQSKAHHDKTELEHHLQCKASNPSHYIHKFQRIFPGNQLFNTDHVQKSPQMTTHDI